MIKAQNDCLKFKQSSSLLDAWKTNPLKWGSEVFISLTDKTILADFTVDTEAQMNTAEEKKVWQAFIENFRSFLVTGETRNSNLTSAISESRKSRLNYFGWAILGALTGGLLAFIYTKLTDNNSTLNLFIIPIMTTIFLSWRIKYSRTKNAI